MQNTKKRSRPLGLFAILIVVLALVAAACSSDDSDDGSTDTTEGGSTETTEAPAGERSINVAIVGNPQMDDIASLTPELFTAETGITVNYTILEEQTLREIVTRDVAGGGEQFDVVMIGMYEAPQFGAEGWLYDLNAWAAD
ncbi:MAG: extracellular solute-binding protein, partial [Acidimicrobiia bacterium]